ncbi:hypothetical protein SDC9_112337 [bioreactor metagenome]|uniref:DUF4190 domain-containing protein n=1 Tax=bioreactor metagenome TaxID=1076179 RepID=A0A645BLM9_9ZZZZ|nr:hypothetical protein [Christensenella sp.]
MEQYTTPLTPEMQSHNKSSVTAMVLGIVSLVVTWFPIVGLVLAIVGLTMSRSNRKFAEAHGFKENSMNTAGYVTSIVGLVSGVITLVLVAVVVVAGIAAAAGIWQYVVLPEIM